MDSQQVLYSTTGPVRVSIPHNASVQQRNYTTTTTYQVPGESQSTAKFSSSRAGRIEAPKQFAVQEEYQEEIPIQQPGYTELHCVQSQQNLTATQSIPSQSFSYVQHNLSAVASAPLFQEHVQTQYVMQQQPQVQTQYVIQQQPQVQTQYVIQQQPQVQTQYVIQQQPNYYVQGSLTHSSISSFSQSALLPLQATSLHQTSLNNIHSQQQQQQLYQYVEVEGPPQYVEVPGPKQYVDIPQPPKLVEIPQPPVCVEIDSPSQIVRVPSPRHLVQVPAGEVTSTFTQSLTLN